MEYGIVEGSVIRGRGLFHRPRIRRTTMNADSYHPTPSRAPIDLEDPRGRLGGLVHSARIHGQRVWLELLRDREEWNGLPVWAQDEAIRAVAERLGERYSLMSAQFYECGGRRHRVAQFEHFSSGARLNLLPGGNFETDGARDREERAARRVNLRAFLLGESALSQSQWDKVGGADQRRFQGERRPIEGVSWQEAQDWLGRAGDGLSLPSEAEWEYGCRAGARGEYCFGDDSRELKDYARFNGSFGLETADIGMLKPNAILSA